MFRKRIKSIYFYRSNLWNMAVSKLKVKYSSSILGISWAVINPFLLMLAITFVFTVVFRLKIKNFSLFVLCGIFPWMFFSSALFEATSSILEQQSILRQFNLPKEILPLSSVLSNFLNFLIGWCIIYPLFIFLNPKIILLLPLFFIVLLLNFLFVCGLGMIFSVVNVFFRDIGHLLNVLLMFWFWITPIFYSPDMVPWKFRWICNLNPMASYVVYYREVILMNNMPNLSLFIGIFIWGILSLIVGWMFFGHFESKLFKRL